MPSDPRADEIVHYWIGPDDITPEEFGEKTRLWYFSNPQTDDTIRKRFGKDLEAAERGDYDHWASDARGMLALVILLDQFSRNLYRGTADAFKNDEKAQQLLKKFIDRGDDEQLTVPQKLLLYHPLHHAENVELQQLCVDKFRALESACDASWRPVVSETVRFSQEHHDVIEQFGRFPHRNRLLGRPSSDKEEKFLAVDPRNYGQG